MNIIMCQNSLHQNPSAANTAKSKKMSSFQSKMLFNLKKLRLHQQKSFLMGTMKSLYVTILDCLHTLSV